jgi:hypothetical protein
VSFRRILDVLPPPSDLNRYFSVPSHTPPPGAPGCCRQGPAHPEPSSAGMPSPPPSGAAPRHTEVPAARAPRRQSRLRGAAGRALVQADARSRQPPGAAGRAPPGRREPGARPTLPPARRHSYLRCDATVHLLQQPLFCCRARGRCEVTLISDLLQPLFSSGQSLILCTGKNAMDETKNIICFNFSISHSP